MKIIGFAFLVGIIAFLLKCVVQILFDLFYDGDLDDDNT